MEEHKGEYCHDCEVYVPFDVFKGICRPSNDIKTADEEACKDFNPVKKCKFCEHYTAKEEFLDTAKEEFLGTCMAETLAYADLLAKTCGDFEWKKTVKH